MDRKESTEHSEAQGLLVCGLGGEGNVDKAIKSDINIKMLTDLAPTIIWTRDETGKITYLNSYWYEFTGCPETLDEVISQQYIHPDDIAALQHNISNSLNRFVDYEMECRIRRADGEYRWFRLHNSAVYDGESGKAKQWLGVGSIIHDLKIAQEEAKLAHEEADRILAERTRALEETQRQVLEEIDARQKTQDALQQAQKMESVGQLTGGIAHDFNNMLTVIIGNLELMKMSAPNLGDNPVAKRMERNVSMAIEAALKAEKLTSQLLAFSRKARLQLERLDANSVVLGVKEMIDRAVGGAIDCEIDLQDDLWLCLSDKTQLESAIINLAINARDAMPHGGHLCIVTRNKTIAETRYVSVAVKDNGQGMSLETQAKACEPFFTTKDVGKGSGLGLSMVYGFTQQSNGKLNIESEEGKGTCVEMLFPYTAGDTIQNTRSDEGLVFDGDKQSILVVDDEPAVRELACQLLCDAGYNVISAEDGKTAIEYIEDPYIHIDLLFTDVVMPGGIDGFAVARVAQKERPGMPIVFTTGHAEVALKELRKDLTQKLKVIGKPYRLNELSSLIANELHGK